jgi:hypothetical protein
VLRHTNVRRWDTAGSVRNDGLARHRKKFRALEDQRLPDQSPPQLRKSKGGVVYQHDMASISGGKNTIFELTHMLETATCRAYPEELSGL